MYVFHPKCVFTYLAINIDQHVAVMKAIERLHFIN